MRHLTNPMDMATLPWNLLGETLINSAGGQLAVSATSFFISRFTFPEMILIREVQHACAGNLSGFGFVSYALGDVLPTTDAEFNSLTQLFPSAPFLNAGAPSFVAVGQGQVGFTQLRTIRHTAGRHLVIRVNNLFAAILEYSGILVYVTLPSSMDVL